jgi:hypothetical protein
MSKSAMGENPLDFIVPAGHAGKASKVPKARKVSVASKGAPKEVTASAPAVPRAREKGKAKAIKATFNLPESLVDEARAAVVALAGPPARLTLAALVEKALRVELDRLEKAHNGGRPFPPVEIVLRGGRPIGT